MAQADSAPRVAEVGMLLSPLGDLLKHRKHLKEKKKKPFSAGFVPRGDML